MTAHLWLGIATKNLVSAGISTARLDALILLEDQFGKDRAWLLANPDFVIEPAGFKRLNAKLERRLAHEPLAYIRGKTEFYGREFLISKDTLEPRPESETIIELLKQLAGVRDEGLGMSVVDVGTGSGALAITAKLELPELTVFGTEISKPALRIARKNAEKLNADITFFEGNLLEPISPLTPHPSNLVLLCNLPYVPDDHTINQAAMQEPRIAIFGGPDGLDLYRQLFAQLSKNQWQPKFILTESLPPQHKKLADIAHKHDYQQKTEDDFIQVFIRAEG